ncbi:MAG: cysteine hydrolase [Candidatus Methanoplasma sp.]|jgi:nicotinamidase-related amidase|nr:cysteine hydrolase [Candidatus Methanoplasma sp.]
MSHQLPDKKDRKIALVVIDVQRKFTGGSIPENGSKDKIEVMNKAAEMFREHGRPVVFVYYDGPCHCSAYDKGDGDEYLHGIVSDPRDIVVHKGHMNSFIGTELAEVVKACGCDSILVCGMVTQYCVMGTYFGAMERDLSPYLLVGGTIATEDKYDDAACVICKTFDLGDVAENLCATKVDVPAGMLGTDHPKLD